MRYLDQPEKPEYDCSRERWNEFMFQPTLRLEIKMRHDNLAWAYERLLSMPIKEVEKIALFDANYPALLCAVAATIVRAAKTGRYADLDKVIDRVIGSAPPMIHLTEEGRLSRAVTFSEFCSRAGYPNPFPKQIEMMEFGMARPGYRLILGSRNYGKTDYVVILGIAWSLFNDPLKRFLIVTKSETRNKGIVKEIIHALQSNGVVIRDKSGLDFNVEGQKGKDPSVSAITIGSRSVRGRHPDLVVMDDPVTPEDASSLAARRAAKVLYEELCKLTPNLLIIGQPVHKSDLYAELRPRLEGLEVPWGSIPELDHDLDAMKRGGMSIESIQASYHLVVPVDSSTPLHGVNSIPEFVPGACVAFIDPSFEGGDYTAMTVLKGHFDGIMVYGKCWKKAWYDCTKEIKQVVEDMGVEKLAFETNALGEQPVRLLRGELSCGVVGRKTTTNKHARIMSAGPYAKLIYISDDSDQEYKRQVKEYEYGIDNDDAPDSLASAMEWVGLLRGLKR